MRLVELQLATFSLPQFHKCFFFYITETREAEPLKYYVRHYIFSL